MRRYSIMLNFHSFSMKAFLDNWGFWEITNDDSTSIGCFYCYCCCSKQAFYKLFFKTTLTLPSFVDKSLIDSPPPAPRPPLLPPHFISFPPKPHSNKRPCLNHVKQDAYSHCKITHTRARTHIWANAIWDEGTRATFHKHTESDFTFVRRERGKGRGREEKGRQLGNRGSHLMQSLRFWQKARFFFKSSIATTFERQSRKPCYCCRPV